MLSELEAAHDVLLSHGRQDQRAIEGNPNLSAVGVAGEHQVDEISARMLDDMIGIVGLVDHEDDRAVGVLRDGQVEVRAGGFRRRRYRRARSESLPRSMGMCSLTRTGIF